MSEYTDWTVEDLDAYRTELQGELRTLNQERERVEFVLRLVSKEWERKLRRP